MNDWNYQIDYWGWILDLAEGNMVLTEGKMVLIDVWILTEGWMIS